MKGEGSRIPFLALGIVPELAAAVLYLLWGRYCLLNQAWHFYC